jgi:hypothetical protein
MQFRMILGDDCHGVSCSGLRTPFYMIKSNKLHLHNSYYPNTICIYFFKLIIKQFKNIVGLRGEKTTDNY